MSTSSVQPITSAPPSTSAPAPVVVTSSTSTTPPRPSTTTPVTTTWTPSPYASVITITGNVQTVTITPTAPPPAIATAQTILPESKNFFSDAGKAAGVSTAIVLVVILAVAFALWFFYRRRTRNQPNDSESANTRSSRRASRLSQLPFAVRRRSGDWGGLPRLSTQGLAGGSGNEKSAGETITPMSRRTSYPLRVVDQRLDPGAWYPSAMDNGSHASLNSFRDDYDYTRRVLHVSPKPFITTAWFKD